MDGKEGLVSEEMEMLKRLNESAEWLLSEFKRLREENARLRAELAAKEQQNEGGRIFCGDLLNRIAAKDALLNEANRFKAGFIRWFEHYKDDTQALPCQLEDEGKGSCVYNWRSHFVRVISNVLAKLDAEGVKG
jgi:hypothetical protein